MAAVRYCKMPKPVKPDEAEIYRHLLYCHCEHPDKDNHSHSCSGAITISEQAIVLRCKQCGDAKGNYTPAEGQ